MLSVQEFIYDLENEERKITQYLHELITSLPEMEAKIRYKVPVYFRRSWICYINPQKKGGVELVFLRGNEMVNENGLLDARGRSQVMGVIIHKLKDIPHEAIQETLMEAIVLDETIPYKSKRSRN